MKQAGIFITVEGIEGVGKTTAMQCIDQYLIDQNIPHQLTREPGGTGIAEEIRQLLLTKHQEHMVDDTELLLLFASRAQHIAQMVKPALAAGDWVVCDRFTDASFAYQGGGRQIPYERIENLESWVQGDLKPDHTFLLDAPVDIALSRARKRSAPDRIEGEQHEFFERVRQAYLDRAKQYPQQFIIINADQDLPAVTDDIQQALQSILTRSLQ